MSRALLCLGSYCLALMGGAFAQTASDPNDGARLSQTGPDEYTFSWWERAGQTYFLQISEDLINWYYVPDNILPGGDTPDEITFPVTGTDPFFVRLAIWPVPTDDPNGADFDGDKVSNFNELRAGTNPLLTVPGLPFPDEDHDGMSDDWEFRFGLNPDSAADGGPDDDADLDGISNRAEFEDGLFGTDPTDHYNGSNYPAIVAIGFPNPSNPPSTDEPGTLVPEPFVVEVKNGGTAVEGARVTFYTQGADAGQISLSSDGADPGTIRQRLTDSEGHAQVYFKHPSENPPVPTLRFITAKVGSAVPTGNGPVVSGPFAITQHDYTYPNNTVGLNASVAIDGRLAAALAVPTDPEEAKRIFSRQDHEPPFGAPPVYIRNTAAWCYDMRQQMTCISPWNTVGHNLYGGTAITAQHIINSAHVQLPVGTTVRFVTANGAVVTPERTIVGIAQHPSYDPNNLHNDVTVYTLDSPLPSTITPCKMLPANYVDHLSDLENRRPPVLVLDQEEKALVSELRGLGPFTTFVRPGLHRNRLKFYEDLIPGDSGNPAFLIINDTPVLLSTASTSSILSIIHESSGTFVTNLINPTLNDMIAAADAHAASRGYPLPTEQQGQTVQTINLSGFTPP